MLPRSINEMERQILAQIFSSSELHFYLVPIKSEGGSLPSCLGLLDLKEIIRERYLENRSRHYEGLLNLANEYLFAKNE